MKYVALGATGLQISRLCLGCMSYGGGTRQPWALDEVNSRPFIRRALELGINFFDTANMYSEGRSEEVLGRALHDFARREDVVLATKVYFPLRKGPNAGGLSRKAIFNEIDASLRRLGTDYVDLYQIHRYDASTPPEETLEALHDVVKAGKARYLGASSMPAWRFMNLLALQRQHGWTRFVSMQNLYNLLYREEEREMLPLCESEGVGVIPWSPLSRGRLARPYREEPATNRERSDDFANYFPQAIDPLIDRPTIEATQAVAANRGVPAAYIALAWVLSRPAVSAPIVGATQLQQLEEAVAALEVTLTAQECQQLELSYRPRPVVGFR